MPRIIVFIPEKEYQVFLSLSEKEFRDPRAQAAMLIRRELEKQGLIESQPSAPRKKTRRHTMSGANENKISENGE